MVRGERCTVCTLRWKESGGLQVKGDPNDPAGSDVPTKGNLRLQGGQIYFRPSRKLPLGVSPPGQRVEDVAPHTNVISRVEPGQAAAPCPLRLLHAKTDLNARDVHWSSTGSSLSSHHWYLSSTVLIILFTDPPRCIPRFCFESAHTQIRYPTSTHFFRMTKPSSTLWYGKNSLVPSSARSPVPIRTGV